MGFAFAFADTYDGSIRNLGWEYVLLVIRSGSEQSVGLMVANNTTLAISIQQFESVFNMLRIQRYK